MLSNAESKYLADYFEFFETEGFKIESEHYPTAEFKAQYQHSFPEYLFYLWDKIGFACFQNGGFWLVNPVEYEDLLALCLKDTKFTDYDEFYVIGRNAFGELYVIGKNTPSSLTIDFVNMRIFPSIEKRDLSNELQMLRHLMIKIETRADGFDEIDEHEKPMFERCLANYGKLAENEIYGFEPPAVLGGKQLVKNIKKQDLFQYLPFVAQLDTFEIMRDIVADMNALGIKPES